MEQIIATGSIHEGYSFIGPFPDLPTALKFCEDHRIHVGRWNILNLHSPDDWTRPTRIFAPGDPEDG